MPTSRTRALATTLALALLTCVGCTSSDDDPEQADKPGRQVVAVGDDLTLTVPAAAFPSGVDVTSSTDNPPPTPAGAKGLHAPIDITAEGHQPKRPLTLEVPYDPANVPDDIDPARVMGVLSYNEDTQAWEPVPVTFDEDAGVMRAKLNHLSWKWPWEWDWAGIGAGINQFIGEQIGKRAPAAECKRGTKTPGWVQMAAVNNDNATALRSCAESEDGALVIELVNNRSYGVIMELDAPVKWTWVADPGNLADYVAAEVLKATLPSNRLYIPPLGRATVALKQGKWRRAELSTDATVATFIATYLSLALGDLVTEKTAGLLVGPLAAGCLSGFIRTNADATVESLGELNTVLGATVDCVSEVMLSRALNRALTPEQQGRAAASYKALGRVGIYLQLFSIEWTSLDLWIDKALVAGPSIIPISTRPPTTSDIPAELRGTWCLPDRSKCLNLDQYLNENPDGFLDDTYKYEDGSTRYSFCSLNDLGDVLGEPACTTAATMYLTYWPAGVTWDCEANLGDDSSYDGCDPDYTDAHDTSRPRLAIELNHQQGDTYIDSPPMYRR